MYGFKNTFERSDMWIPYFLRESGDLLIRYVIVPVSEFIEGLMMAHNYIRNM